MLRLPSSRASDLRHADDAGLGGGVVGLAGVAAGADHRGDVDDAAAARLHHAAHHRARQAEDRLQVGVDHLVPVLVLHAQRQVVARDAGVVDQDGDVAESPSAIAPSSASRLRRVAHVQHPARPGPPARDRPARPASRGRGADDRRALRSPARSAMARPMPREAPVTSATLPSQHAQPPFTVGESCFERGAIRGGDALQLGSMRLTRPASTLPGPHSTTCVTPCAAIACMISTQRTGEAAWRTSASLIVTGSVSRHVDVVEHGNARRGKSHIRQYAAKLQRRGLHQAAMERRGHRQQHRALGAPRLAGLDGARDRALVPGDHDLAGCVEIDRLHDFALRGLRAGRARRRRRPGRGSPPSRPARRHRFLHRLRAKAHQRQRVAEAAARRRPPARSTRPGCGRRRSPAPARPSRARRGRRRSPRVSITGWVLTVRFSCSAGPSASSCQEIRAQRAEASARTASTAGQAGIGLRACRPTANPGRERRMRVSCD